MLLSRLTPAIFISLGNAVARRCVCASKTAVNLDDPFSDKATIQPESTLQMKRGVSFTILALLALLASVAMALDNNWWGAGNRGVTSRCRTGILRASRRLSLRKV